MGKTGAPRSSVATFLASTAAVLLLASCAGRTKDLVENHTSPVCRELANTRNVKDPLDSLDLMSSMIYKQCHVEAIEFGKFIRAKFREKTYSTSFEVASVFVPEDKLTDYVLESYERVYLTFLISSSYMALGRTEAAAVELRHAYTEGKAEIYNFGEDPLTVLVMAAAWENLGELDTARPYWKRLTELSVKDSTMRKFAGARINDIDRKRTLAIPWRIHWIGRFPSLDYELTFLSQSTGGYYKIVASEALPPTCTSRSGARLSSKYWVEKISQRYHSDYHPLLNAKSWVRAPIGVAYGFITFTTGLALGVGGCAASKGEHCAESMQVGGKLMSESPNVVSYMLKPDLRHWKNMPGSLLITKSDDVEKEFCWNNLEDKTKSASFEITRPSQAGPRAPASSEK